MIDGKGEVAGAAITTLLIVLALCALGTLLLQIGYTFGVSAVKRSAVDAGAAEWYLDESDNKSFRWIAEVGEK